MGLRHSEPARVTGRTSHFMNMLYSVESRLMNCVHKDVDKHCQVENPYMKIPANIFSS